MPTCFIDNTFIKSILCKKNCNEILLDYCINNRVCKYGKKAVIRLLWTVIKRFIFIFSILM